MTDDEKRQLVELEKLANDLYQDGYQCSSCWAKEYAEAMLKITQGADYSDDLVINIYNEKQRNLEA